MAINALQVAWLCRLAKKGVLRPGSSMIEFGPQDIVCSRRAVEVLALFNPVWTRINEVFDGDKPRFVRPEAFYALFGVTSYKSVDGSDTRSEWLWNLNEPFRIAETFDIATNFGTFEHVFNIGSAFQSLHDVLRPGGVALHVLPTFADIDHGFFNIHPTLYFDLAEANGYEIEDLCYVDRWDIRVRVFEENLRPDYDFDALPIGMKQLRDPVTLKNMTAAGFVENYQRRETVLHGSTYPGRCYDYCLVALRKTKDSAFRHPMQGLYGGNPATQGADVRYPLKAAGGGGGPLVTLARKYLPPSAKKLLRRIRDTLRGT
jgi:SAM-dependent methyltransferase